jgi:hypothetical protein
LRLDFEKDSIHPSPLGPSILTASDDSEELVEGDHRTKPGSLEQFVEQVKCVHRGEVSRAARHSDEPLQLGKSCSPSLAPWTTSVVMATSGSMRAHVFRGEASRAQVPPDDPLHLLQPRARHVRRRLQQGWRRGEQSRGGGNVESGGISYWAD